LKTQGGAKYTLTGHVSKNSAQFSEQTKARIRSKRSKVSHSNRAML